LSKIIEVRGLSKSYIINHEGKESYTALRDVIAHKAKKIFSFPNWKSTHKTQEEFWALKDIDFDIEQGDRVGIIGRNGAGKSTLLKILSRITEPTNGSIKIKGRVASLLEVGTGFHPELSGRENIYLNGAILGMSRAEIKKHFDAIVDFAEVEKFLDTPVKRYSSGMYVRLAFAVAAHLEPEILIVDEVLAVGDAQFQKKCLGKMEDVSKNEGRTVLFVSHNMGVVKTLCNRGILLFKGSVISDSNVENAISEYGNNKINNELVFYDNLRFSKKNIVIDSFLINDNCNGTIHIGEKKKISVKISGKTKQKNNGALEISIYNIFNDRIVFYSPGHLNNSFNTIENEFTIFANIILPQSFNGGVYWINLSFSYPNIETYFSTNQNIELIVDPFISINGREFNYENSGYLLINENDR